jgi:hypothetical protein
MNTQTVGLSRFSAAACAMLITAVSAWAFVSSTAYIERDRLPQEVRVYGLPGLFAPAPACLGGCS